MNALPICLTVDQVFLLLSALDTVMMDADPEQFQAIEDTCNALRVTVGLAPEQMFEREEVA